MPIKINSTGGGSVSIDVPSTGGTYTLTAPANNATIFTTAGGAITGNVAFTGANVSINGLSIAPSYGMKNKIINGAMQFAQRGSGVAVTGTTSYYALDRWFAVVNGGTTGNGSKMYQSTSAPTGFQYSVKFGRESGGTSTNNPTIGQVIESINCYDFQGQTVTLSFWARAGANYSSSSNLLTYSIDTGTGTDQGSANIFGSWTGQAATQSTVTLTTSWQRFTVTATIGSSVTEAGIRFWYTPTGTAGADDYFYITGVQLEVGSVATPFEFRQYGTELALCQRYYQKSYPVDRAPGYAFGQNTGDAIGNSHPTGFFRLNYHFPVPMRAAPTMYGYDGAGNGNAKCQCYISGSGWTSNNNLSYTMPSTSSGFWTGHDISNCLETQFAWVAIAEL